MTLSSGEPSAVGGRHRVVIIGSGFGGLNAAKALKRADVDITLISKTTTHLFQPLLYQVATGILSEGDIAPTTRLILRRQKNVRVLLGEVNAIDLKAQTVTSKLMDMTTVTPYDSLIVAAGAQQSYFGNDEFATFAPGMKTIDDALELRGRILGAFEAAEVSTDHAERERRLTFVVVGAGPTGVEVAGQIVELAERTLAGAFRTFALAYQGELSAARAAADAALEAAELGEYFAGMGYSALTTAALAAGDVQTAQHASEAAWRNLSLALPLSAAVQRAFNAQAALAGGDLSAARRWCDDAVQSMTGHHLAMALATRARIAVAEGKREEAERDAHKALACAAESGAHLDLPDVLECLAGLASDAGTHHAAARLFGAAEAIRQQIGSVRFAIYRSDYVQSVTALRDAMGEKDFDAAWAEGAALSIKETIAYAQRGHSWRKRPATGWESLTPTEIDVVRLVGEGLANKDIATRLFVSPRTVQTHLTHVYTKLGFTSRLQLAQAAARRT